jgi:hypothetical protein
MVANIQRQEDNIKTEISARKVWGMQTASTDVVVGYTQNPAVSNI